MANKDYKVNNKKSKGKGPNMGKKGGTSLKVTKICVTP